MDVTAQQEFLDRYQQLLEWALRLTERRGSLARDSVPDAFIAYTQRHCPEPIRSLNEYLYAMVRKLVWAHRRRSESRLRAPWELAEAAPRALTD